MKMITQAAAVGLLATLTACGGSESDASDYINDGSDTAEAIEGASASLSAELQAAAAESGDLACGLPLLPDHRAGRLMDSNKTATFNTNETPETVAAFYRTASEKKFGKVSVEAVPGLTDLSIINQDLRRCRVVAQAQPTGDTNVVVGYQKDVQ